MLSRQLFLLGNAGYDESAWAKANDLWWVLGSNSRMSCHHTAKPSLVLEAALHMSRRLASASWSLLALASIPGAAQGHHVIFHAKGGDPCFCFDLIPT